MISHVWCLHWVRHDMFPVVMHWWYHMRDVCIERGVTCCRLLCIDDITCVMCALKEAWHVTGLLCTDDITCVMCAFSEAWHVAGCYALMISHAWCVHWKRRDILPDTIKSSTVGFVGLSWLQECLDVYVRFTLFTFARNLSVKLDELRSFQSLFCCNAIFVVLK